MPIEFDTGDLLSLISSLNTNLGQIRDAIKDADATIIALSGAPVSAAYVVAGALDSTLTGDRLLTGTTNEIDVTDGGAGGAITLDFGTNFVHPGTGPHALGAVQDGHIQFRVGGAFLSDAGADQVNGIRVDSTFTMASGDTTGSRPLYMASSVTTQGQSDVIQIITQAYFQEPNITDAGDTINNSTTVYISGAADEATNNYALWVDDGTVRIDSTANIRNALTLGLAGSTHGILNSDNNMYFNTDSNDDGTDDFIWGTNRATAGTGGLNLMLLRSEGSLLLGETSNANMEVGVTIQQGGNDNQAFCIKSSDVATALTTLPIQDTETDDYFTISKLNAADGGVNIQALSQTGVQTHLQFNTIGGAPTTDDVTTSIGAVSFRIREHNNSNGGVSFGSTDNMFTVSNLNSVGTVTTTFLIKASGDIHAFATHDSTGSGIAMTGISMADAWDDAQMCRALSHDMAGLGVKGLIKDKWDEFVSYKRKELVEAGIFSTEEPNALTNLSQLIRLHNGAIWQGYTRTRDLEERCAMLEGKLKALEGPHA